MAKINFDAATKGNPGISTCAIVIKEDEQHYTYTHELGEMDNHTAEWAACIYALEHARELNVQNALLYTDSKLIADSIEAGYVKNANFKPYFDRIEIFEKILIYYLLNGYRENKTKKRINTLNRHCIN